MAMEAGTVREYYCAVIVTSKMNEDALRVQVRELTERLEAPWISVRVEYGSPGLRLGSGEPCMYRQMPQGNNGAISKLWHCAAPLGA